MSPPPRGIANLPAALRSRVLERHDAECSGYSMVWLGDFVRRDFLGREHHHGSYEWLLLKCNNSECRARAIVSLGRIENAVSRAVGRRSRRRRSP